jgi:hypothetical protein
MKSVNYLALLILKRARHKIIFKMKKLKNSTVWAALRSVSYTPPGRDQKIDFAKKLIF